jgi:hypothetical protein
VLGTVEGVTWAAPMRSRTIDVVRTSQTIKRLATPAGLHVRGQATHTRPATPRPSDAARPAPATTVYVRRRSRLPGIAAGILLVGIAAAIAFVVLRGSTPARGTAPAPPVAVTLPTPPTEPPRVDPQPAQPAPPAAMVDVTIRSKPAGADVFRLPSETKVGTTPWVGSLERIDGMGVFVVKARGYRDAQLEIDLRVGGAQTVTLKKLAAGRKQPVKDPDRRKGEPVNPFDKQPR